MKILCLGDVVARSGRDAVIKHVPRLRRELKLDVVVVNGENAAAGLGITPKIADELLAAGVDTITLGDHTFDQKEIIPYLSQQAKIVRPMNFPPSAPGHGDCIITLPDQRKVAVINVLGRVFFTNPVDCPFQALDAWFKKYRLGANGLAAVVIDIHGEATAEKIALAHYVGSRASIMVGSHTHVPTADVRIWPSGLGYQTDMGMCGDENGIIGVDPAGPLQHLTTGVRSKFTSAEGPATLNGSLYELDATGRCMKAEIIRIPPA